MTIPSRFVRQCEFCGCELDIRLEGVHQFASGWVKNRDGGGGHGISLRKSEDRWAHRQCVEEKSKGGFGQVRMFT